MMHAKLGTSEATAEVEIVKSSSNVNEETKSNVDQGAARRGLASPLCNDDGTLTYDCNSGTASDCAVAPATTCTGAAITTCIVTVTNCGGKTITFPGIDGVGRVVAPDATNNLLTLRLTQGITNNGCVVHGNGVKVYGATGETAPTTVNGGVVTEDANQCSFALGRFGSVGLGLMMTLGSALMMF